MTNQNKNLVIVLLAIALFTGMVQEMAKGSMILGIILFMTSVFLLSRMDFKNLGTSKLSKTSKIYLFLGIFIVLADILYNFKEDAIYGTLDVMTIFFGLSLVGTQLPMINIARISRFGMYFSSAFIVLYLFFYTLFNALHIQIIHEFSHYFLLLPAAWVLNLIGLPVKVISMGGVHISGVEDMTVMVADPCSGLYSMFLLIGIVLGYSKIENIDNKMTTKMLVFSIAIAHVSNMFRITIILLTAYYYGSEAMLTVHTHLGWILFAGMAGLIMFLVNRTKEVDKKSV